MAINVSSRAVSKPLETAVERYKRLSEAEQVIVRVMSVCYLPVGTPRLYKYAREAGLIEPYETKSFSRLVSGIMKCDLAKRNSKGVRCVEAIAEHATLHAVALGEFAKIAAAFQGHRDDYDDLYHHYYTSREEQIRDIRIALYCGKLSLLEEKIELYVERFPDRLNPLAKIGHRSV